MVFSLWELLFCKSVGKDDDEKVFLCALRNKFALNQLNGTMKQKTNK